jgi:hypothetical protein
MPDRDLDAIQGRHTKRYAMGRDETDPDIRALITEVEQLRLIAAMYESAEDEVRQERDHARAYKEFAESFAAKLRAVHILLDKVDLASPGRMVIEVSLVREAANTGVVPDLPKRANLI